MKNIKIPWILVTIFCLGLFAQAKSAEAALTLRLESGGVSQLIVDNGTGDSDGTTLGAIRFDGSLNNFSLLVAATLSKPLTSSSSVAELVISVVSKNGRTPAVLNITASDGDFILTPSSGLATLTSRIGGTTGGTTQFQSFVNINNNFATAGNGVFTTGIQGPMPGPSYDSEAKKDFLQNGAFTLTAEVVITLPANAIQSFGSSTMVQPFAQIGDFIWNDLNRNGVQDSGEPGIAGRSVALKDCNNNVISTTATDLNGYYHFIELLPGQYVVEVDTTDHMVATAAQGNDTSMDSDIDANGLTTCITLNSFETNNDIDAGLYQNSALGDFVWNDLNHDGIQDVGEIGIPGIKVYLMDCNGNLITDTSTDADGLYHFINLLPGMYIIKVDTTGYIISSPGQGGTSSLDSDINGNGMTTCTTLTSGETNNTLDAGLYQPTPAIDIRKQAEGPDSRTFVHDTDVTFEIVVTNTGNAPLSNVEVGDTLVPACAKTIGDLAPGASTSYTCTATNVIVGFTNIATVSGSYNGITFTDNDESTVVIITPSITIKKSVSVNGGITWHDANDITACADAPQAGSCDGTPSTSCGQCDGKVSDLTMLYHGTKTTTIKITNKDGYTLFDQAVQPGGQIYLAMADSYGKLTTNIKLYIDGLFHASIHTSCSQPIGPGLIVGDFEVVSGSSLNGGELCRVFCEPTDSTPGCGTCDGKVNELTLGYTGSSNAKVQIFNKDGDKLFEKLVVTSGEMLSFSLANNYGKLTPEIKIYLNSSYHTSIHTSCSQPIGPGMIAGKFQVESGSSLNGGILCPYDGNAITSTDDKPCEGKITELEMVYRGLSEKTIKVKDKDGRELFKNSVKPGGKIKISGKDNSGTCTSEVAIYVNDRQHGTVKTDCSVDIGSGYKVGEFEVNSGKSSHGGKLSKVKNKGASYQSNQEYCTYQPPAPPCVPDQVSYRFIVTNNGDTPLSNVYLNDSLLSACTVKSSLSIGESDECTIGPFNAEPGLHTNTATVTGDYVNGNTTTTVTATDSASYCSGEASMNCGLSINITANLKTVPKPVFGDGSCYDNDGHDKDGYNYDGYDRDGFDRHGCNRDGFDKDNYDRDGFDRNGRCRQGHSKSEHISYGYDAEGYDMDNRDRNGYTRDGYDRQGYDHDGLDMTGYSRHGYDKDGFNKDGFDQSGHCREGHSKYAHQQYGTNKYDCDLDGYDRNGRDKNGYDRHGYNRENLDREGYDRDGWDKNGHDQSGHTHKDHDGKGCPPYDNSCPLGNLVTYTYTVSNIGSTLQNVVVTDDKLGYIGTVSTLATNEFRVLSKTACIKATTTNTATAVVESWQQCSSTAQTMVEAVCMDSGNTHCNWWDNSCYDKDGYNRDDCNRAGYDWDGYNKDSHRDHEGYDRDGKDKNGYDRNGNYGGSSSWDDRGSR